MEHSIDRSMGLSMEHSMDHSMELSMEHSAYLGSRAEQAGVAAHQLAGESSPCLRWRKSGEIRFTS